LLYKIGEFIQQKLIDYDLDISDLGILSWFYQSAKHNNLNFIKINNEIFYEVHYSQILNEALFRFGKDRLSRRIKAICSKGILKNKLLMIPNTGYVNFFNLTDKFDDLCVAPLKKPVVCEQIIKDRTYLYIIPRTGSKQPRINTCQVCKSSQSLCDHHIVPASRGGTFKKDGKLVLCRNCHKLIHTTNGKVDWKQVNPEITSCFLDIAKGDR